MKHIWIVVVGIVLFAIGELVQQIMNILARIAFLTAGPGSYSSSDYVLNLFAYNSLAALVIAVGVYAYISERVLPSVFPKFASSSSADSAVKAKR